MNDDLLGGYNAAKNVVSQVTNTAKQLGTHAIKEVEHIEKDHQPVTDKTLDQINDENRKFWERK